MSTITVEELAEWIASRRDFVLLDVREPSEFRTVSLPGTLHIPMRQLPSRLSELDPGAEIAVLCHHGGRSEHAARFLTARGFSRVYNVEGGIDRFSLRVDPALVRY